MSNNIAISITADVADLATKRAILSAELKAATKDLNAFAREAASSGSTDALREGMLASANAAEKAKASIAQVNAELKAMAPATEHIKEVHAGFTGMIAKIHEGAEAVRTFQMRAKEFAEVYVAMFAVERVTEFIAKMGEASEKTEHLARQFGLTVAQMQGMQGVALATSVPIDTLTHGMAILDRTAAMTPEKFAKLGIEVKKGESQMDLMLATAARFKEMADGPNKVAAAMLLMGRNGAAMLPILNEGKEGLQELLKKADEYGMVNAKATEEGVKLAVAVNEGKMAWAGLGTTLTAELAPALTEMVKGFSGMVKAMTDSYKSGGTVKIILDAVVIAIKDLVIVVSAVAGALGPLGDVISFVSDNIQTILPIVAALATLFAGPYVVAALSSAAATVIFSDTMVGLWGAFALDGIVGVVSAGFAAFTEAVVAATTATLEFTIALLANPLTWVAVAAAAAVGGLVWLATHVRSTGDAFDVLKDVVLMAMEVIKTSINIAGIVVMAFGKIAWDAMHLNWGAIKGDWAAGLAGVEAEVRASAERIKAIQADLASHLVFGKPAGTDKPEKPGKPDGTGDVPDLTHHAKQKKPKDDLVQNLEAELTAKKLAWAKEQDAHGTAIAFSLQVEADYWSKVLERTNLSAKDRAAIETKYLAVHSQILKQKWADEEAGYKTSLDTAAQNAEAKLDLVRKHTARVGEFFGLESTEFKKAKEDEVKAERAAQAELDEITRIHRQGKAQRALMDIQEAEKAAQARVAMGQETNSQLLAEERQFAAQKYTIIAQELQKEYEIASALGSDKGMATIHQKMLAAEKAYQEQLTETDRKGVLQRAAIERTAITSTASLWSQNIAKLVTLQQGFSATLKGLYTGMVQIVSNALASILEQWLVKHISTLLLGRAASSAAAVAQVTSAVGLAGANGVASFAAAPWPIDMGAPAFGASMAAAAAAFAPAASAAGGWWEVPQDTTTRIHAGEMVLPAWAAQPLRGMIAGGAANSNAPAAAIDGGGDFHFHDHTGTMTPSMIHANRDAFAKAMIAAHREGKFSKSPLGR
jgi:hypothetical protein